MMNWKYTFARKVVHYRIYVVIGCALVSLFFLSEIRSIRVETRLEDFLPQKHPFIKVQHRLTETFGGLNQVSIALEAKNGNIFTHSFLSKVISITEDLSLLDNVNIGRIQSIASRHIKHVVANEEGFFVERLLRDPPQTPQEMEDLKAKIILNPNIYGRMVSKDFKSTLIQVDFESSASTTYIFNALHDLKKQYQDYNTNIYIGGRPILEGWLNYFLPRMLKVLILSFFVISVVLYLTFRSKRGVILPLLDSSMATLWGVGAMKLIGLRLDPSTILVPFIVLSLGISHSVHAMKRYYEEMADPNMKSKHAVVNTMAHLFVPGVACVITDGFGFFSLLFVPLPTIKSMALASGLGIFANFFTSFLFTPCVLSWLHRPKILEVRREETHKWVDAFLMKLSVFSLNKKAGTILVAAFICVCLVSVIGISRITIGDNTEGSSHLFSHGPYNTAERFINSNFGGTNSYYVLVESDSSIFTVEKLRAMDNFQQYLMKEVPEAGDSLSVVQSVKALNMFMLDGKRQYFRIPDTDDTVAQYWFLYTLSGFPNDYDHVISPDEKTANIKFDLKDHKAATVNFVVAKTREYFKKFPRQPVRFSFAGGDIGIFYATNQIIRTNMIPNILFISGLILIYISWTYRSFVAGWILFLPLVMSNLIVFACFGFLRTSINTEMFPLISLSEGLGINYGIYVLSRLYDEIREKKKTYRNILYHTLVTSGKAVFFSGFIVSTGIFVWIFSPILYQAKLGLNLCITLILNMIIALVMVPVFVWWIKPRFLFGRIRERLSKKG